jgi:hypothetical protein
MPAFLEAIAASMRDCRARGMIDHYPERLLVDIEAGRATPVPEERQ